MSEIVILSMAMKKKKRGKRCNRRRKLFCTLLYDICWIKYKCKVNASSLQLLKKFILFEGIKKSLSFGRVTMFFSITIKPTVCRLNLVLSLVTRWDLFLIYQRMCFHSYKKESLHMIPYQHHSNQQDEVNHNVRHMALRYHVVYGLKVQVSQFSRWFEN